MERFRLTVKEINDYADSLKDKNDIYISVETFITEKLMKFKAFSSPFDETYYPDGYDYVCKIEISEENGHIICRCFDYEKYNKAIEEYKKWYFGENRSISNMPDNAQEEFHFELPLTRGFSDCPKRSEVSVFSNLDVQVAVEEGINAHFGKSVLYPYQVKAMFGNELELEEQELDALIESVC